MSNVLYFPNLSLPDAEWVNPAILFFDEIGVISPQEPYSKLTDLFDERTCSLVDGGVVKPVWVGEYYYPAAEADDRVFKIVLDKSREEGHSSPPADSSIHLGKFARLNLMEKLLHEGLIHRDEGEWVTGPNWLILYLMSYLALQLSSSPVLGMGLVTDKGAAWNTMTGQDAEKTRLNRRLEAATSLLPISENVTVDELLQFRRARESELGEFRNYVEFLLMEPDDKRFEAQLDEAERSRSELIRAIEAMNWGRAITRVLLSAAPMVSSIVDHSPWSAAAGLIPLGQQLRKEYEIFERSREAHQNPLAFAALAQLRLGAA